MADWVPFTQVPELSALLGGPATPPPPPPPPPGTGRAAPSAGHSPGNAPAGSEARLVDINAASGEELVEVLGLLPDQAERIIREREAIGGFTSPEQVGELLGLKPHEVVRLRRSARFSPLYISSIVHGLKVRQKFLLIMEARALGVSHDELKQLDMEKNASRTADANRGADRVPASNQRSRETAASPVPAPNRFLPPQPEPVRETKAIDLNTASESELADLPGVGVILAKKAIRHREANGGFHTADEFFETLRLPPHAVVRLRPLVTVSAVLQAVSPSPEPDSPASMSPEAPPAPPASPSRGRVVDY
jgi:DNA uptake protein ComE-like DNA-binding protein